MGLISALQCLSPLSLHVLAEIKTQDAVFILAYAVIMLNTDQHSPNIRVSVNGKIPSPLHAMKPEAPIAETYDV